MILADQLQMPIGLASHLMDWVVHDKGKLDAAASRHSHYKRQRIESY